MQDRTTEADIAVLMPIYNDEPGLLKSLRSLPTEEILDVVIVDDGSTPPLSVPEKANGHNVRLLKMPHNSGIEAALNYGLEFIRRRGYRFVARLDGGDVAVTGRFAKQRQYLLAHPECVLVGSHVEFVRPDDSRESLYRVPTEDAAIRRAMHYRTCFLHPAIMFRANILDTTGLYSTHYPAAEDYELFFRFLNHGQVANLDEVLCRAEDNPAGISRHRRRRQLVSCMKIKLTYFAPTMWESYVGLIRDLTMMVTPYRIVRWLKRSGKGR